MVPRFFVALLLFHGVAEASYRVYRLRVTEYDAKGKQRARAVVLSNIDHLQYEHYHSGYRRVKVEYIDSWYCPGDTHRRAYCRKPKVPERSIAETRETRTPIVRYDRQPVIP